MELGVLFSNLPLSACWVRPGAKAQSGCHWSGLDNEGRPACKEEHARVEARPRLTPSAHAAKGRR